MSGKSLGEIEDEAKEIRDELVDGLHPEDFGENVGQDEIDYFEMEISGLSPVWMVDQLEMEHEAEGHPDELQEILLSLHEEVKELFHENGVNIRNYVAKERFFRGSDVKRSTFVPRKLSEYLTRHFEIKTPRDSKRPYIFNRGYFRAEGSTIIEELIGDICGEHTKNYVLSEGMNDVKRRTFTERDQLGGDPRYICVANGVYDVEADELREHDPKYGNIIQVPVEYDPEADCENFLEFLEETLYEEDIPLVQEMFGMCLYTDIPVQKAFMMVGDGANGKSTLIQVLRRLLGTDNYSSVELQDLSSSRFKVAELQNKLANLAADLPNRGFQGTAMFKKLTGEDSINAERKNQDPFEFENFATLVNSANSLPEVPEESGAFFRRWSIINFPYKFVDNPTEEHEKEKDPKIVEKMMSEEELSGIFNWAIEGLNRVLDEGELSVNPSTEEVKKMYRRMENTVGAFTDERLVESSNGDFITKDVLYQEYVSWCVDHGLEAEAKNQFSMKLQKYMPVEETRPSVKGKRKRAWKNIKWAKGKEPGNYDPEDSTDDIPREDDEQKQHTVFESAENQVYDMVESNGPMTMPEIMSEFDGETENLISTVKNSEVFDIEQEEHQDMFVPLVSISESSELEGFRLKTDAGTMNGKIMDFVEQNEDQFEDGIPVMDIAEFFRDQLDLDVQDVEKTINGLCEDGSLYEIHPGEVKTM